MPVLVDLSQPFANACDVQVEPGQPPTVRFQADPRGAPEALWFSVRLHREEAEGGAPVQLILANPDNLLGGAGPAANFRPVWRRGDGDWERLPGGRERRLADGRREIEWHLEPPFASCEVAWCYPYGPLDQARLLSDLGEPWRADTIGVSQGGRPVVRLSSDPGSTDDKRPGIYCLSRQHAGETPGSWALDGFLRAVAAAGEGAPLVWCVPLANIDGVVQGEYGKDPYPYDLNRAWGSPPRRHETLAIGDDLRRWQGRCRALLAIDWHAPGACENEGVYTFRWPSAAPTEAETGRDRWAERARVALAELARPMFAPLADYPSRWRTPSFTRWVIEDLGIPALTFEIPYGQIGETVLTRETYREIGRRVAGAVLTGLG